MDNQWIFVVLCITLVGQLVLGSLFPSQDSQPSSNTDINIAQQVQMQLANLATVREAGETINTRTVQVDETEENGKKAVVLPTIIVINDEQNHPVSEIVIIDKEDTETKKLLPTNNS